MDDRFLHWFAGQLDGDGSIGMRRSLNAFICIKKAEKGKHALDKIQSVVGGALLHRNRVNEHQQDTYLWDVRGTKAVNLARRLIPYLQLKRRQAEALASWQSKYGRFSLSKDGHKQEDMMMKDVVETVGRTAPTVLKYMRSGEPCNGYVIAKVEGNAHTVFERLQYLKSVPDVVGSLHQAYVAGFFDAEGCIRTQGSNLRVTIAQKDPAILHALQALFGGSVLKEKNRDNYCHTLCATNARKFLAVIQHNACEKHEQVQLGLKFNKDNWDDIGTKMKALRGCQL